MCCSFSAFDSFRDSVRTAMYSIQTSSDPCAHLKSAKTLAKQRGVYDTALKVPDECEGGKEGKCDIIEPLRKEGTEFAGGELTETSPAGVMFGLRTDVFCLMCSWIPVNVRRICICLHSVLNSDQMSGPCASRESRSKAWGRGFQPQ
ncbi:hypothetical protein C8J55DRAFT_515442 [Lentinula edodes]|uniref:Uncharacterized protein n=1 Tax=Lentinula lateritia TaxID=40482 RepID=A0A9W9A9N5_9AGAR|nr:hypothetical protein C8J55DRAFT_515442 [Lentinula edodes]